MNGKKKVAIAALVYLTVFLIVYALAAEMQMPEIPALGGGEALVEAPGNVDSVSWVVSSDPPRKITGATLTFDQDLPTGTTIYVELYQHIGGDYNLVASGQVTLTEPLGQGSEVTITMDSPQPAARIDKIAVTVVCP
jgi:hypothetical protein